MRHLLTKVRDSDCGFTSRQFKRHVNRHARRLAVREIEEQVHPDALCSCGGDCYGCEGVFVNAPDDDL